MKTKSFLTLLALVGLTSTISFAQTSENSNPYAIFGSKPYVAGADAPAKAKKIFAIENFAEGSPITRLEHDTETGVVQFFDSEGEIIRERKLRQGERAWPTVDRFAEKYYSISPYAYAANNPVNAIDINGDSIWYTRHENTITMHITGNVINQSSSNINGQKRADNIAAGITKAFSGPVEINGQSYNMVVDAKIGVANSMADVSSSDHLFVFADRIRGAAIKAEGATSEIGGKVMTLHSGASNRSAVHEFGHAAGLEHKSATGAFNLMSPGKYFANTITSDQRQTMLYQHSIGNTNRGSNSHTLFPLNPRSPVIPNPFLRMGGSVHHINQYGLGHR